MKKLLLFLALGYNIIIFSATPPGGLVLNKDKSEQNTFTRSERRCGYGFLGLLYGLSALGVHELTSLQIKRNVQENKELQDDPNFQAKYCAGQTVIQCWCCFFVTRHACLKAYKYCTIACSSKENPAKKMKQKKPEMARDE